MAFNLSIDNKQFRLNVPLKTLVFLQYYSLFQKEVPNFLENAILDGVHTEKNLHYYQPIIPSSNRKEESDTSKMNQKKIAMEEEKDINYQILLSPNCPIAKSTVSKEIFLQRIHEKTA